MQKTNLASKAKNYLNSTPFKVQYVISDVENMTSADLLYEEEYPDFIPERENIVIFGSQTLKVINIIYHPDKNLAVVRTVDLNDCNEYYNKLINKRKS